MLAKDAFLATETTAPRGGRGKWLQGTLFCVLLLQDLLYAETAPFLDVKHRPLVYSAAGTVLVMVFLVCVTLVPLADALCAVWVSFGLQTAAMVLWTWACVAVFQAEGMVRVDGADSWDVTGSSQRVAVCAVVCHGTAVLLYGVLAMRLRGPQRFLVLSRLHRLSTPTAATSTPPPPAWSRE